jgi:hypothetical protein
MTGACERQLAHGAWWCDVPSSRIASVGDDQPTACGCRLPALPSRRRLHPRRSSLGQHRPGAPTGAYDGDPSSVERRLTGPRSQCNDRPALRGEELRELLAERADGDAPQAAP